MLKIFSGKARTLEGYGVSAIHKILHKGAVQIDELGITGDEVGDLRHHGGVDRAILLYPAEHYCAIKESFPCSQAMAPGALGENFSVLGFGESSVRLGDIYSLGGARLQICQPRSPCFKLGLRAGDKRIPQWLQENGATGYFFRVLSGSQLTATCRELKLLERDKNELPLSTFLYWFFADPLSVKKIDKMLQSKALADHWRRKLIKRLETGVVESWGKRLGYYQSRDLGEAYV